MNAHPDDDVDGVDGVDAVSAAANGGGGGDDTVSGDRPLLWSIPGAAHQIGDVSTKTIQRLITKGDLVRKKVGRHSKVTDASLRAYERRLHAE